MPAEVVIYTSCTYFPCSKMHTFFKSKMLLETRLGSLVRSYQILTDTGGICPWFVNFSLDLKLFSGWSQNHHLVQGFPNPRPLYSEFGHASGWLEHVQLNLHKQQLSACASWTAHLHVSLPLAQRLHVCQPATGTALFPSPCPPTEPTSWKGWTLLF